MPEKTDFRATFEKLKAILKPYEKKLIVVHDTDKTIISTMQSFYSG